MKRLNKKRSDPNNALKILLTNAGGIFVPVVEILPSNLSLIRTIAARGNRIVLKYEVSQGAVQIICIFCATEPLNNASYGKEIRHEHHKATDMPVP